MYERREREISKKGRWGGRQRVIATINSGGRSIKKRVSEINADERLNT